MSFGPMLNGVKANGINGLKKKQILLNAFDMSSKAARSMSVNHELK